MTLRPAAVLATAVVAGTAAATATGLAVAAESGATAALLPATRLLLTGCGVAAVGLAVLRWLATDAQRRDADAVRSTSRQAAIVVAGAWAAMALVVLWLQAADVSGRPASRVDVGTVGDYVGGFGAGAGLLIVAVCAIGFGAAAQYGLPDGLLAVIAVFGVLPAPVTGHAASSDWHEPAVLAVSVHATAAAVWIGGLGALLVAAGARRTLLATALPRFSRLATWCLVTLAASGVLNSTIRLASPDDLTSTSYGRILLVKATVLGALAVVGLAVRRRVLPLVVAHRPSSLRAFATVELLLMATALGLATALTRTVP